MGPVTLAGFLMGFQTWCLLGYVGFSRQLQAPGPRMVTVSLHCTMTPTEPGRQRAEK